MRGGSVSERAVGPDRTMRDRLKTPNDWRALIARPALHAGNREVT